jgi:hypothetical protein
MTMTLSREMTIADIIDSLMNPEDYLCGVLDNMRDWKNEHGTAYVSIGTTGQGIAPHYRVGPSSDSLESIKHLDLDKRDDLIEFLREYSKHCRAFHGRSHKRLDWGVLELRNQHWSTRQMSFEEVQSLLGQFRGYKRK